MKKNIFSLIAATILGMTIALCMISTPALAANSVITEAKAKSIALKDAGYTEKEVVILSLVLDEEDTPAEYEISFCHGTVEYTYHINARTGAIISSEEDDEFYINPGCLLLNG